MFDMFGFENDHKIAYGDEVVLLTTVYDIAVLGMVRGLLEDANIIPISGRYIQNICCINALLFKNLLTDS